MHRAACMPFEIWPGQAPSRSKRVASVFLPVPSTVFVAATVSASTRPGARFPSRTRPAVQIPYSYKGKLVFRAIILSVGILSLSMDIADELAFLPIFSAGFPNGNDVVDVQGPPLIAV